MSARDYGRPVMSARDIGDPLSPKYAVVPKTPAERKEAERQRHRDLGRVEVRVWVQPEDRPRVQRYADRINQGAVTRRAMSFKGVEK